MCVFSRATAQSRVRLMSPIIYAYVCRRFDSSGNFEQSDQEILNGLTIQEITHCQTAHEVIMILTK